MCKVIEMPKSKTQYWGDLFRGRKLEAPKYNAKGFDDLFNGFQNQVEKRQAELYRQAQEVVNLDDLGIGFGSDFIDPRDEEPWSDTQTRLEQMNSIKGR